MKMKKFILPLYYAFISFLFTLESIIYINDAGDQTSFAHMAQKFGFFEFAIYRYKTWSSRLLIESVTMFMSNHYLLFDVTMLISVAIFSIVLMEFSKRREVQKITICIACYFPTFFSKFVFHKCWFDCNSY